MAEAAANNEEIDQPALIPHIAEASSLKYPYEVLFRSLHKLHKDTATSEYPYLLALHDCYPILSPDCPFAVIDEHFNSILPNWYDAIGLMLMIHIVHQHQLIMSQQRIPCLDSYLDKVWLSSDASLIHLNVEYENGQLELNMERLRMAVDDLLMKLAKMFSKPKLQIVFLINNCDMTIAVLKEACPEDGKIQLHFEEMLKSNTGLFVEELLMEHFSDLIKFVKTRAYTTHSFHQRKIQMLAAKGLLSGCIKRISGGAALNKDLVSISSHLSCMKSENTP
ncbi:hypothetical protein V6N13_012302 [Hibiscus sabdariffa]